MFTSHPSSRLDRRHLTRTAALGAVIVASAGLFRPLPATARQSPDADAAANKRLVRRVYETFSGADPDDLDEVIAADYVSHPLAPGQERGVDGFKGVIAGFRAVFPDLEVSPVDLVAEADKVAARLVVRGTHEGEILGIPPTGRRVEFAATDVHRIDGGRIQEIWHIEDYLGLLTQLGVGFVPADSAATPPS